MSSGRGGNNNRGNPWGSGRSFAQVTRDPPPPAATPDPQQPEDDMEGFQEVENRRNRNRQQQGRGGFTGAPSSNNSGGRGNGPQMGGPRHDYQDSRGRGAPRGNTGNRGDSYSHSHSRGRGGRGRGRGRGRGDIFGGQQQTSNYQGGAGGKKTPPSPLYKDLKDGTQGDNEVSHAPSQKIKSLEDNMVAKSNNKSLTTQLGGLKLDEKQIPLPLRPGYGSQGRDVDLFANYFEIGGVDKLELHEYIVHVQGNPNISLRVKRRLFTLLLREFPGQAVATNYVDKIICIKEHNRTDLTLPYREENETVSRSFQLSFQHNRAYRIGDVLADLESPVETYQKDERNMAIQALNMAVAHYPNLAGKVQFVGQSRHFFLDTYGENLRLGGGLEARRGFFHSVKTSTGRLLLNLNVSTAAFYCARRLIHVAEEAVRFDHATNYEKDARTLDRFLKKVRISTTHGTTRRTRTITEIAKLPSGLAATPSQVKFFWAQGVPPRQVSVKDYFRQQYNMNIAEKQIVVNIGSHEKPCYLPAEVCTVLEGQVARQKLSPDQTSNMIKIACRSPGNNALDISTGGLNLMGVDRHGGPEQKFGIKIAPELLAVKGKILQPPRLKYEADHGPRSYNGAWNFLGYTFKRPGVLPGNNPIGYLVVGKLKSGTHQFKQGLTQTLQQCGINWRDNKAKEILVEDKDDENAIRKAFADFQKIGTPFVVAIFLKHDQPLYSKVKYCGDIVTGIPTVCVVEKLNTKEGRICLKHEDGTLRNIALKINLKLGGVNHEIESHPQIRDIMRSTMFIGIDVTHPTGTESQDNAPSIAAVVANNDHTLAQWPADVVTQGHRKEMLENNLLSMVLSRLRKWKNQRFLPKHIMVYRDGVSESQYQEVLKTELAQIKEAVKTYYEGRTMPKITLLIVGKRHHTRFYPLSRDDPNSGTLHNGNVAPGTVVDRYCTMERNFDFFMVSHAGIQGTSRPAHYVVLYDENKFEANTLQAITHDLTYVYGRASRAVSLATPAYYADIVCERGRYYLHSVFNNSMTGNYDEARSPWVKNVHQNLEDTMFYI